jgi:thiol-disulfide isomerase/thioredoxin
MYGSQAAQRFGQTPARRRWLARAAAASLLPWALAPTLAAPANKGERVAWPTFSLLDGSRLDAKTLAQTPVVLVFWSTTCPFCRRHNEHLNKLVEATRGKGPLRIIGAARDRDAALVRRVVQERGYRFDVTMDAEPLRAALASRNIIPLTVVVGADGRLREVFPGEMFEEDVLELAELANKKA